jgi:hypothetical protein
MLRGMYLRSACDGHLDPAGVATIEGFVALEGQGAGRSSDDAPDRGGRHAGAGARFSMRFCQ